MISVDRSVQRWLDELALQRTLASSTESQYRYALSAFERWLGQAATLDVLADRLSEWIKYRSSRGYSPYGIRTQRGALVTLLRFAEESGVLDMPLRIRNVRLVDLEPRWFTDDQLRRLLDHADGYQRAAILLVRSGAMRRGDVLGTLRWRGVGDDVVRWVMDKPGRRHAVRVSSEALDACRAIRREGDDRLVPFPLSKSGWHKRWKSLGRRSGVDVHRRGLQAIRRVASSLVAREHGELAAAKLLGHNSGVAVFRRYYAIGPIVDELPPSPPPLTAPPPPTVPAPTPCGPTDAAAR